MMAFRRLVATLTALLLGLAPSCGAALVADWTVTMSRTSGGYDDYRASAPDGAGGTWLVVRLPGGHRLVAYDAAGTRVSSVALAGSGGWDGDALAVAPDGTGAVLVARSAGAAALDIVVSRHAPSGSLEWERAVDGGGDERPAAVAVDLGGTVWVAGWRESPGGADALLAAIGPGGTLLWSRTADFGAGGDDAFYAVVPDGAGGVLAAGPADRGGNPLTHVAAYGPDGALRFSRTLSLAGGAGEFPRAAALAGSGVAATLWVAADSGNQL
ncbi:MAG: hypothetical protein AAB368_14565, partial [bacterium]